MQRRHLFLSLLIAGGLALPLPAAAGFKCWTNKDGVRECGNAVPPEYAQQEVESINERGIVTDVQERAKTQEELAEEERLRQEEEVRLAEEKRRREEQAAYDRVLLSTFTNEQDLIDSRDRKVAAIDATIDVTKVTIGQLEEKLDDMRKRAANLERGGKPIPEDLVRDIDNIEGQIANKQNYIASKEREREELLQKYAADLERFRQLKGR